MFYDVLGCLFFLVLRFFDRQNLPWFLFVFFLSGKLRTSIRALEQIFLWGKYVHFCVFLCKCFLIRLIWYVYNHGNSVINYHYSYIKRCDSKMMCFFFLFFLLLSKQEIGLRKINERYFLCLCLYCRKKRFHSI